MKDLPSRFADLRHKMLSYSSFLASLPPDQLGNFFSRILIVSILFAYLASYPKALR